MTKILRFLLCLEKTVIEGARIREKGIAVDQRTLYFHDRPGNEQLQMADAFSRQFL